MRQFNIDERITRLERTQINHALSGYIHPNDGNSGYAYDATTGNVTSFTRWADTGKLVPLYREEYYYDATTGLLSAMLSTSYTGDGKPVQDRLTYTYDASGNLLKVDKS